MARSYDIAEIMVSDGGLPEQVRRKINANFRRVLEIVGRESRAVASSEDRSYVAGYVQDFWDENSKILVGGLNDDIESARDDAISASKSYTDSEVEEVGRKIPDHDDLYPTGCVIATTDEDDPRMSEGTWEKMETDVAGVLFFRRTK